jgi:hypothetical protein
MVSKLRKRERLGALPSRSSADMMLQQVMMIKRRMSQVLLRGIMN